MLTKTPTILPATTDAQILEQIIRDVDAGHRVRLGRWSLLRDDTFGYAAYDLGFIEDTPENRAGAKVAEEAWWTEHDFEEVDAAAKALLKAYNGDW